MDYVDGRKHCKQRKSTKRNKRETLIDELMRLPNAQTSTLALLAYRSNTVGSAYAYSAQPNLLAPSGTHTHARAWILLAESDEARQSFALLLFVVDASIWGIDTLACAKARM